MLNFLLVRLTAGLINKYFHITLGCTDIISNHSSKFVTLGVPEEKTKAQRNDPWGQPLIQGHIVSMILGPTRVLCG